MFPAMPYKLPGRERSGAIAICHLAQMNKIAAIGTFSLCPAAGRLGEIVWIRHIPALVQPRQFFRALYRQSAQFQVGSGSRPLEAASFTPLVGSLHDCCNSPSLRHASGDIFPNSRIPLLVMCVSSPPYCWAGE